MQNNTKVNWFESPLPKNMLWSLHDDQTSINFSRYSSQKTVYLTPYRNSRPVQIQSCKSNQQICMNHIIQAENYKFDDFSLPALFSDSKIQPPIIDRKINFNEDQQKIQQEDDFKTPSNENHYYKQGYDKFKVLTDTSAKKSSFQAFQEQKKSRPREKGLRRLSQKAYQIVLKLKGSTYKQVANELFLELSNEQEVDINGKDQQNIKRRVYDALNVLIALGVIKKEGRRMYGNGAYKMGKSLIQCQKELELLKQQSLLRQFRITDKKQTLNSLIQRRTMLQKLFKRNKLNQINCQKKIRFPFVLANLQNFDQNLTKITEEKVSIITSQKEVTPLGDLDTIDYLKIHLLEEDI